MPRFCDIPQFVPSAAYHVHVDWKYLQSMTDGYDDDADFQRGHVWIKDQQIAFVEYALQGGMSGRHIYFNNPTWQRSYSAKTVLVDGKQRLTAVLRFMSGDIPAFGYPIGEWTDRLPTSAYFEFWVNTLPSREAVIKWYLGLNAGNTLPSREAVIKWYLGLNAGGTPHTPEEIARVRALVASS